MARLATRITTDGMVNASSVVWRVGARVRVTVVAKACLEFGLATPQTELVRPLPVFIKDRWGAGNTELQAVSDIAPFIPTPEVLLFGRATHKLGRARVGLRVVRQEQAIIDKHADVDANAAIAALGPRPSNWPIPPEAFQQGIVSLPSLDGAVFQRAAEDQRVLELKGSEEVVLIGLYQANPLVRFQLLSPSVEAVVRCGPHEDAVPLCIDTLAISLADRKCTLLWRGSVPLRSEQALADLSVKVSCRPDPRTPIKAAAAAPRRVGPAQGMGTISLKEDSDAMQTAGLPAPLPFRSPRSSRALPFPEQAPARSGPESIEPKPASGTPWSAHDVRMTFKPADGAFETLPLSERMPELPAEPPPPVVEPAPKSAPAPAPPPSKGSPWREDPPEDASAVIESRAESAPVAVPAPPAASPFKAPKKDLNASLYRRPKPR